MGDSGVWASWIAIFKVYIGVRHKVDTQQRGNYVAHTMRYRFNVNNRGKVASSREVGDLIQNTASKTHSLLPSLQVLPFSPSYVPFSHPPTAESSSLQHSRPSPSNLVSLPHVLGFPAPTHHRAQTDPAIEGDSREHGRALRAPLNIKAPAALCGQLVDHLPQESATVRNTAQETPACR
jgi:hypothetical protein